MTPLKNLSSIRFIAMIGILFGHSTQIFSSYLFNQSHIFIGSKNQFLFYSMMLDLWKFATIVFFIISGYLFQLNRHKYNSFKTFIHNKYKKLLQPYIIIFFIPLLLINLPIKPFFTAASFDLTLSSFCISILKQIFFSNYWFIPVLVIYFIINFFLPYKYLKFAFPVSVAITLFYSFNLYHPIVPTAHTLSILGFCSFFFLGRVVAKSGRYFSFNKLAPAIILFVLAFAFTVFESYWLSYSCKQVDAWNTLKLSNVLYALAVLSLLNNRVVIPKKLLETDTYFIYLSHPHMKRVVLLVLAYLDKNSFIVPHSWLTTSITTIIFIILCYGCERFYTKAKLSSFTIDFHKPFFVLKPKS
jgi:probable poly-beta-1,6-N-acetyl-D-glucosamine export protein